MKVTVHIDRIADKLITLMIGYQNSIISKDDLRKHEYVKAMTSVCELFGIPISVVWDNKDEKTVYRRLEEYFTV